MVRYMRQRSHITSSLGCHVNQLPYILASRYNLNMSKRQVLILLGIWIAVFLFLGFPPAGDRALALVSGLLVVWIAFRMRPAQRDIPEERMPYAEHKNQTPETAADAPIMNNPLQPHP